MPGLLPTQGSGIIGFRSTTGTVPEGRLKRPVRVGRGGFGGEVPRAKEGNTTAGEKLLKSLEKA